LEKKVIMNNNSFRIPILDEIYSKLGVIEENISSLSKTNPCIDSWLTTKQVAKLLDLTERTLQTYRDRGDIPFSQYGRVVRYRAQDVQEFLMSHYVKVNNGGPENE
jgi:excisionase family DNA binding protein